MHASLDPFSFLVVSLAGWMNQHPQHAIHYLMEENRVLREQIGNRRLRFTDDQRRRLAGKAKRARPEVAIRNRNDRNAGDAAPSRKAHRHGFLEMKPQIEIISLLFRREKSTETS